MTYWWQGRQGVLNDIYLMKTNIKYDIYTGLQMVGKEGNYIRSPVSYQALSA